MEAGGDGLFVPVELDIAALHRDVEVLVGKSAGLMHFFDALLASLTENSIRIKISVDQRWD